MVLRNSRAKLDTVLTKSSQLELPPARRSACLARGIVTRRAETMGSVSAANKARPASRARSATDRHLSPSHPPLASFISALSRRSSAHGCKC
jgi:hypothetical protein